MGIVRYTSTKPATIIKTTETIKITIDCFNLNDFTINASFKDTSSFK